MLTKIISFFSLIIYFTPSLCQTLGSGSIPFITGEWELLHKSIGISAMHMQLLHNNKVVIFDRTDFGPSNISLPGGRCRFDSTDKASSMDCTAHSVLYDIKKNTFRPLTIQSDTWCSSGGVLADGTLVQTGGYGDGDHVVRTLAPCAGDNCDWVEFPGSLTRRRWYATDQMLPDGRVIIIGGRGQFNYEFYPKDSRESSYSDANSNSSDTLSLQFLHDTKDEFENNLYPFVHLLPDGNLLVFANTRCIILDYKRNLLVKELPSIKGGESRNYPSSGSSVLLPIDENNPPDHAEIMVCGGAPTNAYTKARSGIFVQASATCGRLIVTDDDPKWSMETMPMPRVMSEMTILPSGNILIINGASAGTAGWENANNPVTRPLIYKPNGEDGNKFSTMEASPRPRLYHSTALLLTDGRVLVGGSNPHPGYNFTGVKFPTDLSLEAFHPPYLATRYDPLRPKIVNMGESLGYSETFSVTFTVPTFLRLSIVNVKIIAPSFTTHAFSMNQRMVVLKRGEVNSMGGGRYSVNAVGPSKPEIAPPGYYMLFVVHAGVPSSAVWVNIR